MPEGSGAAGSTGSGSDSGQGGSGNDSQQGGSQQGSQSSGSQQQGQQQQSQGQQDSRTFTQADVDRIVQDRLARESAKYGDYDDLKRRVTEADEASKSELQKASERAEKAEAAMKAAEDRARSIIRHGAITAEATSQGAVDAGVVAALLADDDTIVVAKDDSVAGAKDAVARILKEKPFLKGGKPAPSKPGGEFGGNDPSTIQERIAALEADGKFPEARRLKMEQAAGLMDRFGQNGA